MPTTTPEPAFAPTFSAPMPAAPAATFSETPPTGPIADAFAAILAAEQNDVPMAWPSRPTPTNGNGSLSEDAIEEIVRRVLDRLSDQGVRSAVAEVVSTVAERLVKEEIERIKASIK
jgi:hypothetical protein